MQLPCSWRATGLDAVCGTYSDFTFYKQTRSTFTFSLPALDATTDDTPGRQREVQELPPPSGTEPRSREGHGNGDLALFQVPGDREACPDAHACSGGHPRVLGGHPHVHRMVPPLQTPQVSLGPWQLCPGAGEGLGGSPALAAAEGEGPARRKPNHRAGETKAGPAALSQGRGVSRRR